MSHFHSKKSNLFPYYFNQIAPQFRSFSSFLLLISIFHDYATVFVVLPFLFHNFCCCFLYYFILLCCIFSIFIQMQHKKHRYKKTVNSSAPASYNGVLSVSILRITYDSILLSCFTFLVENMIALILLPILLHLSVIRHPASFCYGNGTHIVLTDGC